MHYIIICDDGTDISDLDNVFHDLVFKCHPVRGIRKVEYYPGMALDPYLDFHERQYGMGACTVIDCTWPKDWDPEIAMTLDASFRKLYPKFIQDKVLKRWEREYGFNKIEGKI